MLACWLSLFIIKGVICSVVVIKEDGFDYAVLDTTAF